MIFLNLLNECQTACLCCYCFSRLTNFPNFEVSHLVSLSPDVPPPTFPVKVLFDITTIMFKIQILVYYVQDAQNNSTIIDHPRVSSSTISLSRSLKPLPWSRSTNSSGCFITDLFSSNHSPLFLTVINYS